MSATKSKKTEVPETSDDIDYNGPALAAARADEREQPEFNDPERPSHEIVSQALRAQAQAQD